MSKKKRKTTAPHPRTAPPSERRQVISYDDIEEAAAPPIPRQKVSYASDDDNDDDGEQAPDQRHAVLSAEALKERERPQTDVTYGQQGAFPGLDARDREPFYGPANHGLDYLRMVRSEARGIPHIVTAPSSKKPDNYNHEDDEDDYEEHVDDYGGYYEDMSENGNQDGWYEDGAYVAPSIAATPTIGPERPGKDPQDAFYDALKTRFESLRYRLRAPPSVQAVHQLDHRHPISLPFGNRLADKEWKNHLIHTTPLPAQLASLDTPSILRLLKLVEGQLENCRKTNIPHNLSLWAWSLLARLEDVGLLQTRDVSVVRDLAKMAAWVRMMHLRTKYGRAGDPEFEHLDRYPEESAGLHDDGDYEEEEGEEEFVADDATKEGATHEDTALQDTEAGEEVTDKQEKVAMDLDTEDDLSDIMAAKKRQLQAEANVQAAAQSKEQEQEKHHDEVPDINTNVTIDMLITVAADFYGQKDLLVGRLPW